MNDLNRAVILAAGKGTRLKSLTKDKPKALMPVGDEPAIYHVIRHLVGQGIHDIAINIHHHAQQLRAHLGDGSKFNARLYYSEEENLLDSGGGARTAVDLLPEGGPIAIYNADIISSIDLHALAQTCPEQGCCLALVNNPKHNQEGDFSIHNHIITPAQGQTYTFSGVSVWREEALSKYPSHTAFSLTTPIRELMAKQNCFGSVYRGLWFDIGRPRDLIQANRLFQKEAL